MDAKRITRKDETEGRCTVLVKMSQNQGGLERVIGVVNNSGNKLHTMTARLSLDGETFYLTLELADAGAIEGLEQSLRALEGVRGVETSGSGTVGGYHEPAPYRVDFSRAYN